MTHVSPFLVRPQIGYFYWQISLCIGYLLVMANHLPPHCLYNIGEGVVVVVVGSVFGAVGGAVGGSLLSHSSPWCLQVGHFSFKCLLIFLVSSIFFRHSNSSQISNGFFPVTVI